MLLDNEEFFSANLIEDVLEKQEQNLWSFLVSNELWGSAGSIADQALLNKEEARKKLEKLLVKLGTLQLKQKKMNVRTEMWVTAFKH